MSNSQRAVTLKGVWNSKEISFKKMEVDHGKGLCKTILLAEITKMVNILKADMQEVHIDYLIDYIMNHYYSYSISDITCLTDRLVKNNPYGKPILQNIVHELDKYSVDKQEFAVEQRKAESASVALENDKIVKIYEALKKEAKEHKPTQKEIDAENLRIHNEKLEELKKIYGKDL